jgi:hypothetical protein
MHAESSSPEPIQTTSPWSGILFLGGFAALWIAVMYVATRAFLPQRPPADPVLAWFLGVMWAVAAFLVGWTA